MLNLRLSRFHASVEVTEGDLTELLPVAVVSARLSMDLRRHPECRGDMSHLAGKTTAGTPATDNIRMATRTPAG
jgi:hypothetical protein